MDNAHQLSEPTPTAKVAAALIKRVERVVKRQNVAETTFGKRAVGDDKALQRLRNNRLVIRTVIRLEEYLDVCDLEDGTSSLEDVDHAVAVSDPQSGEQGA